MEYTCEILMKEYNISREYAEIIMQMPSMDAIIELAIVDKENNKMKAGDLKCID